MIDARDNRQRLSFFRENESKKWFRTVAPADSSLAVALGCLIILGYDAFSVSDQPTSLPGDPFDGRDGDGLLSLSLVEAHVWASPGPEKEAHGVRTVACTIRV